MLDEPSLLIIKELKEQVSQQANSLFEESIVMDSVAKEAF
jgi:hypothetical protein